MPTRRRMWRWWRRAAATWRVCWLCYALPAAARRCPPPSAVCRAVARCPQPLLTPHSIAPSKPSNNHPNQPPNPPTPTKTKPDRCATSRTRRATACRWWWRSTSSPPTPPRSWRRWRRRRWARARARRWCAATTRPAARAPSSSRARSRTPAPRRPTPPRRPSDSCTTSTSQFATRLRPSRAACTARTVRRRGGRRIPHLPPPFFLRVWVGWGTGGGLRARISAA